MGRNVEILDIPFYNTTINEIVTIITQRVSENKKTFIVTANPEIVMFSHNHEEYKRNLTIAEFIIPDGIGIIMASKILNNPLQERIAGYDLMMELLAKANEGKWKIFLLGGREEVNFKAFKAIENKFPDLEIVGRHNGYFDGDNPNIGNEISNLKPDLVLVALGFPRQEDWIAENLPFFDKGVFIGVGGSLDVLSGSVKRAPEFWQKMNLEWLYRLIIQPSRWRRMTVLPIFVLKILKKKSGSF